MSSIQERKFFLQLWSFTSGPAIDVMQHYFEVKILINIEFEDFLNDPNNIHQLFHQCFPTTPCCKCMTTSLASARKRGCLNLQQFDKLYDNSGLPQPNHENMTGSKILQHCLCKFSAKCSVTVDELDITLFYDVVQHCCPLKMNLFWRKNIKDVRNFLAHIPNGQVNKADFEDNWKTLTNATLGFAGEIGNKCKKMFQEKISEIENSSLEALKEKLKKSNEDLIKMLDTINGIKQTTVDECKKTVELINNKQDENFNKLQSSFGKTRANSEEYSRPSGKTRANSEEYSRPSEPEEDTRKTSTTTEIEMSEEPEQKKRKTAITFDIEQSEYNQIEDANKSLNQTDNTVLANMKILLQKLGEIPLLDHCIDIYTKYIEDLKETWAALVYFGNEKAILDNLLKEKIKRTNLLAKLKDAIHNQDEFTTTNEEYCTDIQFLNVGNPATKCNYCHTEEASKISCYCKNCRIFICNNCVTEHRIKNKHHQYWYKSDILREYERTASWRYVDTKIIDIKYMATDTVVILNRVDLRTYKLSGELINSHTFGTSLGVNRRITSINDCNVAVTEPQFNKIYIVTIVPPIATTDLGIPVEARMTGGITCRMDILYVAFSDAIRLMDLSGQIQRVFDIPNVNILHSVNNNKMLCVHSKDDSDKTMSYLDFDNGKVCDFERFPFHPEDVTTDEVGNILFIVGGVIWQADSDGNNVKIIISRERDEFCQKMSYGKDSKTLVTTNEKFHKEIVQLFRKLE